MDFDIELDLDLDLSEFRPKIDVKNQKECYAIIVFENAKAKREFLDEKGIFNSTHYINADDL